MTTMPLERPSLRLVSLSDLKHPFSVDLYLENVAAHARFVIVRLLGGADYWRYGVDELAAAARMRGFDLAIVPGDGREDARLAEASTLSTADLAAHLALVPGRWTAKHPIFPRPRRNPNRTRAPVARAGRHRRRGKT